MKMGLNVLTIDQHAKWDAIVHSFNNYDIYYLSGYVKAFQLHGDGEPLLFYYESDIVRGINVVMKRDIAEDIHIIGKLDKKTYFDFSTPYGYGGWLIEGNDARTLFKDYEIWCREHQVISEFVRFHPILKNHSMALTAYEVVPLGHTVAMDLSSPGLIWENITSKNRNVIRKSVKNDIKIFNGRSPALYEVFRKIYNATMDRDHADEYYYFDSKFYDSILQDLPYNAQVFYADMDGKIIAASIILMANGRLNYHLSGSLKEYRNLAPTNLLLYQVALWGYANHFRSLYLGGGVGSGEDSLFHFKRAFYKGELQQFHIGHKIFLSDMYDQLVTMRSDLPESNYFPKYRA